MQIPILLFLSGAFIYLYISAGKSNLTSEDKSALFLHGDLGAAFLDQNGVIRKTNPKFDSMFDSSAGGLEGKQFSALFREKDRRGIIQRLADMREKRESKSILQPIRAEGLSKSWSRVMMELKFVMGDSSPHGDMIVMARDVTTEVKLTGELARLQNALDHADEAFTIADADGVVEYVNETAGKMNGGAAAPAKGERLKANPAAGDNELENRGMWDSIRIGRSWKGEISRIGADGARYFEEVLVYPVKSADGEISNYLSVRRDISSRKNSEKLISTLTRAMEHSAEMIVVTDSKGIIEYVNPAVERNLGYSREELIGARPSVFKSGVHTADFYTQMWSVIRGGEPWNGRITNRKKCGELIEEELSVSPVFGDGGGIVNFVAVARDISRNLERERELILRKEEAEASNRFKDDLISIVSHDLKNPIVAALGLARLALQDNSHPRSPVQSELLNRIVISGERAMDMIEKLLLMSPSRLGRWNLNKKFINVFALADLVFDDLASAAEAKKIKLENLLPVKTRFHADYDLFYEVVSNMVSNSIKFTNPGGRVSISVPAGDEDAIEIRDTGVGIEPERIPNLFRKDVITITHGTAGEKGYGMGLPFCNEVVAKHGGSISVESAPNHGTVFTISLPSARPVVMLVDDDGDFRVLIKELLSHMDVETVEASNGSQALEMFESKSPCLLITDLFMEPMNGFELLKEVKRRGCGIAKIAVTSDTQIDTRNRAFASGAQDFVTKPIVAYDFIPRVRRLLEADPA